LKAWEYERKWIENAVPPDVDQSCEQDWLEYLKAGIASDEKLFKDWYSEVPGSKAPCHLVVAAIQSMHNRGYDVTEAEKYIEAGLQAEKQKDGSAIQQITSKIYYLLNTAKKDENCEYWKYKQYKTWQDIEKDVIFPKCTTINVFSEQYAKKVKYGWLGQLIGGALGTQIEGYTTENIFKKFGEVKGYLREPETYNDDITYELAFLQSFIKKGYDVTSQDIAQEWLALIADGYSAEETALYNLRRGIMPPESGIYNNYFCEWIGAQMRTAIHGMVAPANPSLAAKLAVYDSVISHSNNGIIGGMFNAMLVSLSFVEKNAKELIEKTIALLPQKSEYAAVANYVLEQCKKCDTWQKAWEICQNRLKQYHWIHCYPNVAAEIVALWYGENDFEKTCHIICMEGQDVDCTAAPVLNALAILIDFEKVDQQKYVKPIGNTIYTMMRKFQEISVEQLCCDTVESVKSAVTRWEQKERKNENIIY